MILKITVYVQQVECTPSTLNFTVSMRVRNIGTSSVHNCAFVHDLGEQLSARVLFGEQLSTIGENDNVKD